MNKILIVLPVVVFMNSCGIDSSIFLGKNIPVWELPYGIYGFSGFKYIEGKHHRVNAVYYMNKVLVYVRDDNNYIVGYFFSNIVKFEDFKNLPPVVNYSNIIDMFGKPAFLINHQVFHDNPDFVDVFFAVYFQRTFDFSKLRFRLHYINISLTFDSDGYLMLVAKSRETDGGTIILNETIINHNVIMKDMK